MASVSDSLARLNASVATLGSKVDGLIAAFQAGQANAIDPAALDAVSAAVESKTTAIDAVLPPTP